MDFYVPSYCFCHYDIRELLMLARQKFLMGKKTVELMHEARTDKERSQVAIISLLDLDDAQVVAMLQNKVNGPDCHILSCRDMLRNQLEEMLGFKGIKK